MVLVSGAVPAAAAASFFAGAGSGAAGFSCLSFRLAVLVMAFSSFISVCLYGRSGADGSHMGFCDEFAHVAEFFGQHRYDGLAGLHSQLFEGNGVVAGVVSLADQEMDNVGFQ